MSEMNLYDNKGNRLYLTAKETASFLKAAGDEAGTIRTLAETLVHTGCRVSEVLALKSKNINLDDGHIIFRSLKKRRNDIYRVVPVPFYYLDRLNLAHGIRQNQKNLKKTDLKLWSWHRQHVWRIVKKIMDKADIMDGPHKTAKGIRHAYGVNAVVKGVPLNMLSKWMGHANIETTAIYANAIGAEEQSIAARMWEEY